MTHWRKRLLGVLLFSTFALIANIASFSVAVVYQGRFAQGLSAIGFLVSLSAVLVALFGFVRARDA